MESSPATRPPSVAVAAREDLLGLRLAAALIDLALMAALFIVVDIAIGPASGEGGAAATDLLGFGATAYFALVALYYFTLEATIGQTVGKLMLGLRVVSVDGEPPSVFAIAARTLFRAVDFFPFLYLVGFVVMLTSGTDRQRVGDLVARTTVRRE